MQVKIAGKGLFDSEMDAMQACFTDDEMRTIAGMIGKKDREGNPLNVLSSFPASMSEDDFFKAMEE
jgi:hypothetical protein